MPDKDEVKKQQNNTPNKDKFIFWAAIIFFTLCFLLVAIHFSISSFGECVNELNNVCKDNEWADYRAAWGQFGDFMGGMVNPFLGLLTVYLLVTELRESRAGREHTETALNCQIGLTESQNNFSNYFTHLEGFKIHLNKTSGSDQINLLNLHKVIFPSCIKGDYSLSEDFLEKFKDCRNQTWEKFKEIDGKNSDALIEIIKHIDSLAKSFYISVGLLSVLDPNDYANPQNFLSPNTGKTYPISADNIPEHISLKITLLMLCEKAAQFDIRANLNINNIDQDLCQVMIDQLGKAQSKNWGKVTNGNIEIKFAFGKVTR